MNRENKTFQVKIETKGVSTNDAGQEFGHLECYAAVFNVIDQGNDMILPNSFKRTIKNAKDRAASRKKKYLIPILWQHDANEVIGGWHTLSEDSYGLKCIGDISLATQRGREYWELAKADMSDTFSIIYDIPNGGSSYNKSGVRELSELRLFSCDPVTFPMCEETLLVSVKSLQSKTITGNTSGPIGPRDEAWSGSKAEGQIWDAAYDEDTGKINTTLAKKYFMVVDGDAQKKGSYSYPFWFVGDSPHICVGAVKAIAGAIGGARGANAPDGLKSKVETLYNRINKKYPDDPQLSLDDGKSMNRQQRRQLKTLMEHYNEEQAADLCEDWQDVFVCSLTSAILDAFTIGDQPASDVSEALDAFKELVMSKFVPQAIECDLSGYLEENTSNYSYSSAANTLQNGSSDGYGYMSRANRMERKAGKPISAANQSNIDDHVAAVHDIANQASKSMKASMKALHDAADTFAEKMQGNQADSDDPNETPVEKSYTDALRELKALRA